MVNEHFFIDHAFFFFEHAERILQDRRMFFAPVPVSSSLAYIGESSFATPTLGAYLEWWLQGGGENTKDCNGNDALIFHFSGSPLSGSNSCSCVYPDGSTSSFHHPSFVKVWRNFIRINKQYDLAKHQSDAYTLQEVYEILNATE